MRRVPIIAALVFVTACDAQAAITNNRATADQHEVERRIAAVNDWEQRTRELASEVDKLRARYAGVREQFESASAAYRNVVARNTSASTSFAEAKSIWQAAQRRWELYQLLVQVAAALDAHNLDKFRALTGSEGVDSLDCSAGMSTEAFRRLLVSRGFNLIGKDIDHIVPRALGGADHPANYRIVPSSLNRSLGSSWGPEKCASVGAKCAGAIGISRTCGSYEGPDF